MTYHVCLLRLFRLFSILNFSTLLSKTKKKAENNSMGGHVLMEPFTAALRFRFFASTYFAFTLSSHLIFEFLCFGEICSRESPMRLPPTHTPRVAFSCCFLHDKAKYSQIFMSSSPCP